MIDWTKIEDLLHEWCYKYSGLVVEQRDEFDEIIVVGEPEKVIWAQQEGDKPLYTYIQLNIINAKKVTSDEIRYKGPDTEAYLSGLRSFTLSIQAFGEKALIFLENLQTSVKLPNVVILFKIQDISFVRASDINNVTELLDTCWEKRYHIDMTFYAASNVDTATDIIEQTSMEGKLKLPNGEDVVVEISNVIPEGD